MNLQPTQDFIDKQIEQQNILQVADILTTLNRSGYKLVPDWEIINDEAFLAQVIDDLVEYQNYSQAEAEETAPDMANTLIEAMWDEYSHVLSEDS